MTESIRTEQLTDTEATLRLETVMKAISNHPLTLAGWKKALPEATPQVTLENAQELLQEMNTLLPPTIGNILPDTIPSDKRAEQLVAQFCGLMRRVIPETTSIRMGIYAPNSLRSTDVIRLEWHSNDSNKLQKAQADIALLSELSNWVAGLSRSCTEYVSQLQRIAAESIEVINKGENK